MTRNMSLLTELVSLPRMLYKRDAPTALRCETDTVQGLGLNCACFHADFRGRFLPCPLTSIPAQSATKPLRRFNPCATNHSASARKSFAGCRDGDMGRCGAFLAQGLD